MLLGQAVSHAPKHSSPVPFLPLFSPRFLSNIFFIVSGSYFLRTLTQEKGIVLIVATDHSLPYRLEGDVNGK